MREAIGESRGTLGWPDAKRLRQVKGWLNGLRLSLEHYRQKWCKDEDAAEAKRVQASEELILRTLQGADRRKLFEERIKKLEAYDQMGKCR